MRWQQLSEPWVFGVRTGGVWMGARERPRARGWEGTAGWTGSTVERSVRFSPAGIRELAGGVWSLRSLAMLMSRLNYEGQAWRGSRVPGKCLWLP